MRGNVFEFGAPGTFPPTVGVPGLFTPRSDGAMMEGALLPCCCCWLRLVFESPCPSEDFFRRTLPERMRIKRERKLGRREVSFTGCCGRDGSKLLESEESSDS